MSAQRLQRLGDGAVWLDPNEIIAVTPHPQFPRDGAMVYLRSGIQIGVVDMPVTNIIALLPVPREAS